MTRVNTEPEDQQASHYSLVDGVTTDLTMTMKGLVIKLLLLQRSLVWEPGAEGGLHNVRCAVADRPLLVVKGCLISTNSQLILFAPEI